MADELDGIAAAAAFSGVVRADRDGQVLLERAYGFAHRGLRAPITPATRFGIASGTKGLTALAVMSLVEEGTLALGTTARSLLGDDLPLIDDAVTVEHLLAHRSGIGDYVDEDALESATEHVLPVPVHELDTTEAYLRVLGGYPQVFPPGARFAYNNGGYVVLALLAERAAGVPFDVLVHARVCAPAGMRDTAFLRGDEPDGDVALGYLEATGLRTNVLHLPVRGSGDGGIVSTAADVHAFWRALFAGRIVAPARVQAMVAPRSDAGEMRYGLGFWLAPRDGAVTLVGSDAGVSFYSVHDPERGTTATVLGNTTEGAWPVGDALERILGV
jgi:CubicO group peptidase (beta-lactamase class C family)